MLQQILVYTCALLDYMSVYNYHASYWCTKEFKIFSMRLWIVLLSWYVFSNLWLMSVSKTSCSILLSASARLFAAKFGFVVLIVYCELFVWSLFFILFLRIECLYKGMSATTTSRLCLISFFLACSYFYHKEGRLCLFILILNFSLCNYTCTVNTFTLCLSF